MRSGWEIKDFENCIENVVYPNKIKRQDFLDVGEFPIVSQEKDFINGYWNKKSDLFKIKKPVVVFGDHTQVFKYVNFNFVIGADGVKVLSPIEGIDSKYFYYFLQSIKLKELGYARHYRLLKEVSVAYPKSISEQKRIVAILDEAFTAIDKAKVNTEKNLQNSKELFESYLQNVFANQGQDWTKETLENLLEKGWILSHLDGNHGGEYPRKEEFKNKGVPYISANCISGTDVDFSLSKFLTPERALAIRKGVAINNDVLFAHNATVGPVALLKTKEEKVILGTSLTYYRCNPNYILPEYLANYMRSKEFKSQYEIIMRQSTRNQVPITKQREFYHIIPPIEIQKQLVVNLDSLLNNSQKLEAVYLKKLDDLEELKKSFLQKAFNGELTAATKNLVA